MSTKTSKRSSSVTTSYSSPQASTSTRPASPLSPTRFTRIQEKQELAGLNDRLAAYIDKVRSLEQENSRLSREIKTSKETISHEVNTIKASYNQELSDARALLDDTARAKAKAEMDCARLWEQNEDLKTRLDKKTQDAQRFESELNINEHRLAELQTKYNQIQSERKKIDDNLKELRKENEKLKKQVDTLKKQLENETMARIEAENTAQSLKEDLNFKEQMFQKQVTEIRSRKEEEVSQIDGRLTSIYEDKLKQAIQDMRDLHDEQLRINKEEMSKLYESKINQLEHDKQRNANTVSQALADSNKWRSSYDSVKTQLTALESSNNSLTNRINDLEKLLENERTRYSGQVAEMELQLNQLRDEMAAQLRDYRDLMDIKLTLDMEIETYRKMLELEESRLNITPAGSPAQAAVARRGTPLRRLTPARGAAKRKRTLLDETDETDTFSLTAEAKGDIEIIEVDVDGKFIQIRNKGAKEISLSGWSLRHTAGERETTFKFHRTVKVEPGATVTVWSADSGHDHSPPEHIVMKQKWFVGDTMYTAVVNNEANEVATRQRQRVQVSTSRHQEWAGYEEIPHGDPQQAESCRLM